MWKKFGKQVTKDRTESMYEIITGPASDGRIRQKIPVLYVNPETITTAL